ncbi:periplasmic binding protein [Marmoricola endophyticus]|uniref:Periplasmic binding protein n=1 Tax=Marmoricola endophyticus TaxID=2040280 RepID=A0A917EY17_9ACTN|nr:iron-siderophore ABC transporter substrate-binding protein [Marmoricola endophyticus]GGF32851.1 periplasmic binding protein [Marmoricola endophyticus]
MSLSSSPRRGPVRGLLALLAAVAMLALVACGSGGSDSDAAGSGSSDGVTIKHAFGTTTVKKTDRIVTWGWGSDDATLALGETPVAIPKQEYGANAEGLMPWTAEKLKAEGASTPALLTNGDEPPYDQIIKAKPDVILATYSGITKDQYDKLSAIAPTVAYPGKPWSTPWREVIETTGKVLGKEKQADEVIAGIQKTVQQAADAHPEFQGRSIAAVATDPNGTNYVYTPDDPRVEFLEDLGFTSAPAVKSLYNGDISFYYTLSSEKLDALKSDVLLEYLEDAKTEQTFNASPGVRTMQQVKDGAVAKVVGPSVISSVSPPTALSLDYSLDTYVDALAKAVKQ